MRPRNLDTLAATTFDLLVVGGGIHGLAIAYDAASRGLRTALVDAGDFGSGASFNHQRTVHGGLRSLQYGRFRYARRFHPRAARARAHRAVVSSPAAVHRRHVSLGHARPAGASRGVQASTSGSAAIATPASNRSCICPRRAWCRRRRRCGSFPASGQEKLTGGAQWYDYQMVEADRLTLAFAAAADRAGADLANYVEARRRSATASRIAGMTARDTLTGGADHPRDGSSTPPAAQAGAIMQRVRRQA